MFPRHRLAKVTSKASARRRGDYLAQEKRKASGLETYTVCKEGRESGINLRTRCGLYNPARSEDDDGDNGVHGCGDGDDDDDDGDDADGDDDDDNDGGIHGGVGGVRGVLLLCRDATTKKMRKRRHGLTLTYGISIRPGSMGQKPHNCAGSL